ncbi:MAG: DUF4136 domain-containing protein [Methylococcaceae bacterium]|nr:DUF4136 domain-containing protein [Methylococcaceae bacterium]
MKKYLLSFIIIAVITGCSSLTLDTDYDKSIHFSNFKTYRWHNKNEYNTASQQYLKVNNLMDQRIRATIDQQLKTQHYTQASTEKVDFLVNYSVVIEDKTDIQTYNNYSGYYPGFRYGAGFGSYGRNMSVGYSSGSDIQVSHYQQGTLIIDIINPETDQLMWRGAADGRLPKTADRAKKDKLIQQYVKKILSDFPPKK